VPLAVPLPPNEDCPPLQFSILNKFNEFAIVKFNVPTSTPLTNTSFAVISIVFEPLNTILLFPSNETKSMYCVLITKFTVSKL
jgi:hypothetical protein